MSGIVEEVKQPEHFSFTPENLEQAKKIAARYPAGKHQSAVMALLALAQKQNANWLPKAAMDAVAEFLGMPFIRVYEVATFYTMYNLAPVGRHVINVCTTTPCWLKGSDEIVKSCEKHLGVGLGETSSDGMFTLREVECLGACVNAPMAEIDSKFYEDLTAASVGKVIETFRRGETPKAGPQNGRRSSEPQSGLTTLKDRKRA